MTTLSRDDLVFPYAVAGQEFSNETAVHWKM